MIAKIREILDKPSNNGRWCSYLWKHLEASLKEDKERHKEVIIPYVEKHIPNYYWHNVNTTEELQKAIEVFPHPVFHIKTRNLILKTFTQSGVTHYIKHIDFRHHRKTGSHLKEYKNFLKRPALQNLNGIGLRKNNVSDEDLEELKAYPIFDNIELWDLQENEITNKGLEIILNSNKVVTLSVGLNRIRVSDLQIFSETKPHPNLKDLIIQGEQVKRKDFKTLITSPFLQNLEHLELNTSFVKAEDFQLFLETPYLKNLKSCWVGPHYKPKVERLNPTLKQKLQEKFPSCTFFY